MAPRKNPTQQTGEIELGGEIYTMFFNFEAVAEAEELTGLPLVLGLTQREIVAPRVSLVRAMLFACLRPKHPEITMDQVKTFINMQNIREVWGRILAVWVAGMREMEETVPDPLKGQG